MTPDAHADALADLELARRRQESAWTDRTRAIAAREVAEAEERLADLEARGRVLPQEEGRG